MLLLAALPADMYTQRCITHHRDAEHSASVSAEGASMSAHMDNTQTGTTHEAHGDREAGVGWQMDGAGWRCADGRRLWAGQAMSHVGLGWYGGRQEGVGFSHKGA